VKLRGNNPRSFYTRNLLENNVSIEDTDASSLNQEKKTLGAQIVENHLANADSKQTVRDTTNEMGKEYLASLEKVIVQHAHLKGIYYITEILKPDSHLPHVIRLYHTARRTRPNPEWGLALYQVNNDNQVITYEWGLPHEVEAANMLTDPHGWDEKLMQDIKDHILGILK
jgi:hypothetical protein